MRLSVRILPLFLALALTACASPEEKVERHMQKAREWLEQEQYDKAKLEARNALQIQPKNAEAHFILAQLAWREENFNEVYGRLQLAVESDPTLIEARLRLGDLMVAAGDIRAAAEQAEAVRALDPERADVHLLSGKVLFGQGDSPGAMAEIDAALARDPAFVDAITAKANILALDGDVPGALAVLAEGLTKTGSKDADALRDFRVRLLGATGQDQALETELKALIAEFPDRTSYRYQLLDFYGSRGRREEQEKLLRELVDADPQNHVLKLRLVNVLVGRNEMDAAEKLLKDNIAKYPDSAELQIGLGDFYRFAKRSKEAMAEYQKAAAKWPNTTPEGLQARNRVVAQHAVDGNIEQARTGIADILKVAPDNADALLARATFLFVERKYEEAIADLRTVVRRQPSAEALLLLARSNVGAGDLVVAKDTYRRLLADFPNHPQGTRELALLLSEQGDAAGAAEILRGFVAVRPDDKEASAVLVQSLLDQRDIEAAEAEARRMMARGMGAEQQLGQVLQAKGASGEALALYRAALEKDPNQVQALEGMVNILLDTNRAAEAIAYLERYPKGDLAASLLLSRAYVRQGNVAAAREVVEQAIAENPADRRPYLEFASLWPTDSPEQVAAVERAWKALPGDTVTALVLGSAYQRLDRPDDAITVYEAALAANPGDLVVSNNLAALLLDHRDDKASLARALELARPFATSDQGPALDTLGWAYYRNGDMANAVRTLERAVAAEGGSAVLQYHLGKAYAATGNTAGARLHLSKALELADERDAFVADARAALAAL